jgi:PAS domain S-box-containing protein
LSEEPVLRILHLEDDAHDRELVVATLRQGGLSFTANAVSTRSAFEQALQDEQYDVILADDRLPAFDGLTAQRIAAERAPETPFIFVSGTLGEDIAVDRVKNGAVDYVLKQRLTRLPGSITRAIGEARMRAEHARAEVEVRRLNAELEQRVLERTTQLADANQALADREQALRHSEVRLNAILDNSPAIITMKDVDGRYLFVNHQFERRLQLQRGEVVGRTDHQVFAPRLADMYRTNDAEVLRQRAAITVEEPALHGSDVFVYSSSKFPLLGADGEPYAICTISSDITDRKHAEDDIKTARLEAERANRAKSEFLSRMSHDLRTPLNAVLGFAQLLASERLSDEQVECVRQILKGGEHLLDLVNEVLDIARIEAGHLSLSPEPVGVREIVEHAVALVGPIARQRHIAVLVDESALAGLSVFADRQRLSQILLNLLSNAVKYNREAGSVTIGFVRGGDDALRITVSDTGSGIPPQKLRLLFRPFERLGAESTAIEGTGLGLTLSRGLAEAMGGSVGVVSRLGSGSTFWVELRIANELAAEAALKPESAPIEYQHGQPAMVLYIEDNISNVRLMERVLGRRPSVTLATAADGRHGVAQALAQRPDLVLLDLHLPDLPGEEVLRQLKSEPALSGMPVVVLSADATPGQIRRLLATGAAGYLTKPFAIHEVLAVVDQTLAGRQRARAHADEAESGA